MAPLLKLSAVIDAINTAIGRWLAWLVLIAVLISATNAVVRKTLDTSSNAWLELQWILFSVVFLLCASWTLRVNEHIRIDIVSNMLPKRLRDWIEVFGHTVFLLPLTIVIIITSYPFFMRSAPPLDDVLNVLAAFPQVFTGDPLLWFANLKAWFAQLSGLGEQSMNAGGLPQWPAKSLVLIGFVLLAFQGVSELIKRIAVMLNLISDPYLISEPPAAEPSVIDAHRIEPR